VFASATRILIREEERYMMPTEESARTLVIRARQTTQDTRTHVRKAAGALERGLAPYSPAVNAVGVFLEPQLRENDLLAARAEIEAALKKMRNTVWPRDSDYRTAESL
jgi:hypothetical protein